MSVQPWKPTSAYPWSSERMITMLGFRASAASAAPGTNDTAVKRPTIAGQRFTFGLILVLLLPGCWFHQ